MSIDQQIDVLLKECLMALKSNRKIQISDVAKRCSLSVIPEKRQLYEHVASRLEDDYNYKARRLQDTVDYYIMKYSFKEKHPFLYDMLLIIVTFIVTLIGTLLLTQSEGQKEIRTKTQVKSVPIADTAAHKIQNHKPPSE